MWQGQAFWVCPALCGCELSITADWVEEVEKVNGRRVSYQHPKPKTITAVELSTTCAAHEHFKTDPLPADPYGQQQRSGYLLPIPATPTEAERLYIQLGRYDSQRFGPDTCGCKLHLCTDRLGIESPRVAKNPKVTKKCAIHASDDDRHAAALEEYHRKNEALRKIRERFSHLSDDDLSWSYDEGRVLKIKAPKLVGAMKAQAQADHNPQKVIIE